MKLIPGEYGRPIIDLIAKAREITGAGSQNNVDQLQVTGDLRRLISGLYVQFNVKEVSAKFKTDMTGYSSSARKFLMI